MILEPMIYNKMEKGKKGIYKGKSIFIFDAGLDIRHSKYFEQKTMTIQDEEGKNLWTSHEANSAFGSRESAVIFAKSFINNL